jgi:hypothetical protein
MRSDLKSIQTKSIAVIAGVAAAAAIIATIAVTMGSSSNAGVMVSGNSAAAAANSTGLMVQPENRTFWIDTIHLDGNANVNGDNKHPPEAFPANITYPKGGGFILTPPDKTGAWNFRSFTFSTSQIVVYQGDRVTLNFVGVQGPSHYIEVQGIVSFPLTRGEIHPVTFTADTVGTIHYYCHIHMPNMSGEVIVLPRPATH